MTNLELLLYTELDLICLFLLIILLFHSLRNANLRHYWKYFQYINITCIAGVSFDLLFFLGTNHIVKMTPTILYLVNSIYFIIGAIGLYWWMLYSIKITDSKYLNRKICVIVLAIPIFIVTILFVISYKTKVLYHVDNNLNLIRGPLYILAFVIPHLYLFFTTFRLLLLSVKKRGYANRKRYYALCMYGIPQLFAFLISSFITTDTPLPCFGFTVGCLLFYLNSQEQLVSLDPLTKLHNRNQLMKVLEQKINNLTFDNDFTLIIFDLNSFKEINDNFGHLEGDEAIMNFAFALERVKRQVNCFLSRYGGDEFIVLLEDKRINPEQFVKLVKEELEKKHLSSKYELTFSYGYARCTSDIIESNDLIGMADLNLYKMKQGR